MSSNTSDKTNNHYYPTCTNGVCAIIVTYFPDHNLIKLVKSVLLQVESLIIVDNTPSDHKTQLQDQLNSISNKILIVENGKNLGIAAALNIGLESAMSLGYKWMLTLDQDTQTESDMVATLLQISKASSYSPAVIGSNYYDVRNNRTEAKQSLEFDSLERTTVITSGSLINTQAADKAGGFRTDFFIDQVDHEFCLRMRANGHKVMISSKTIMTHSVGTDGGPWLPILGYLPNHSPLRKYYVSRNSIRLVLEYYRQEPAWCLRRLIRLLLGLILAATIEKNRLIKTRAFMIGFKDGICSKMGPCHHDWINQT